jgi:serine phosphatase RsbU (regulator of sigma subunit)
MKQYPLLSTLFAKTERDFLVGLGELFVSRGLNKYTIWRILGGAIARPVARLGGVKDGAFDIYDLGYEAGAVSIGKRNLAYFDENWPIYASFFCKGGDGITYAMTFHEPVDEGAENWLKAILPYITIHADEITAAERHTEMLVDYQKKINFIKDSGQILKMLAEDDVVVNALSYFSEMFHSEASCAVYGDFFEGFGITYEDLLVNLFYDNGPALNLLKDLRETRYIEQDLTSTKFDVNNLFVVYEPHSGCYFMLFNIDIDVLPDKEFCELITHIVSIALENARNHEVMTQFKVEEAEMSQTIEILNQFVLREQQFYDSPKIYSVNYPAKSTGGDFTSIIDQKSFTFTCVADVCGKGYAAAVFTVMLATIMESGLYTEMQDLGKLSNGLNKYLLSHDFNQRFITAFFCYYNKSEKKLNYISCGHEPAIMITAEGTKTLLSQNIPLGIADEEYTMQSVIVNPGDLLFIYTDGLTEYVTLEELTEKVEIGKDKALKELADGLYKELVQNPAEQKDDFTCLIMKF